MKEKSVFQALHVLISVVHVKKEIMQSEGNGVNALNLGNHLCSLIDVDHEIRRIDSP